MAAASIWPGWCFSLWVRWSVYSGFPCITSQKTAERTSAITERIFASKRTVEARPEPTAVPLTRARPSLGCSSKNPPEIPARRKASAASMVAPSAVGNGFQDFEADTGVALEERVDPHKHRRPGCCCRQRVTLPGAEDSGIKESKKNKICCVKTTSLPANHEKMQTWAYSQLLIQLNQTLEKGKNGII
ncbi:hypothetical protein M5K25_016188 [Dendrobium thyrsiflorum]|uniref:Uncharacterized protein n=1 Tax=Dendrobium thyrsiflorum TaxID=117978 RepID=A0ABD0UJV9_DENTH